MLHVARKSIDEFSLQNNVTLHQSGVVEIDALFESNHFDLVTSTLVFSELYPDERSWTFRQIEFPSNGKKN